MEIDIVRFSYKKTNYTLQVIEKELLGMALKICAFDSLNFISR